MKLHLVVDPNEFAKHGLFGPRSGELPSFFCTRLDMVYGLESCREAADTSIQLVTLHGSGSMCPEATETETAGPKGRATRSTTRALAG